MPAPGRRTLLAGLLAAPGLARAFPDRPLRLVVAYPAGGGTDVMARAIAGPLGQALGQAVVVENRTGASGTIGAAEVARATPDGHTLLFVTSSEMSLRPLLDRQLPYEVDRDFMPVALVGQTPVVLAVNPRVPAQDVAGLIALAKRQPGLGYASTGSGGLMHLAGEMFRLRAGVDLLHVPYRGGAQGVNDVVAGQVPLIFNGLTPLLPLAREGRLRLLAVTTPRRFPAIPDVPTMAEAGLEGFDLANSVGIATPRGTPAAVVVRLAEAALAATREPSVREVFLRNGAEPLGEPAERYTALARAERARFAAIIQAAGLTLE